jgi:NADPH2:quinone reductase
MHVRAVLCKAAGPPDSLVLETVAEPELGPGEVRIAIRACGINFPDLLIIAGKYQQQPPMPFSPGAEIAGEVIEVADGVSGFTPGQRVVAVTTFGGMAEQICVPARGVVPLPEGIDYVTGAAFLLTYGTAYHALKDRADLQAGETLAVLGAAGGVGLAAVEIGKMMGATVIAAASSADKLELAGEYGADHLINYIDEDLKERIKALTGGKGADVVFDPVGGELFEQCLRAVAWRGRLLVIGFASGRIPTVPANLTLLKGSSIVGVFWGRFTAEEPERNAENTAALFGLLADGKLRPHVSETYPLDQAAVALQAVAARRAKGKIVIEV